jgi:hypothetical protein
LFSAVDQKGYSDIFLYDRFADSLMRLTNDFYDDRDPIFGLTDNEIIFSSDRTAGKNEKKYNLFSLSIPSKRISYVTNLNANSYAPVISPDKSYLLFSSDLDGVRNIWKQQINEGRYSNEISQVTDFITSAFNPRFLNDSTMAFTGFEKFSFNIYSYGINSADTTHSEKNSVVMTFDSLGTRWHPGLLISLSQRENFKYEKEYTLDYAQSQVSNDPIYGTQGGAVISLSDMLGDDNYFLLIHNTADVQSDFLKSFNIAIQRVNLSERANYGYGIFHFSGRRYDIRDSDEFFFERSFGGFYQLNFPLSKFQRLESSVSIVNSDKQIITGAIERKAVLVTNTLSYVTDNTLWGPTGPLDGFRTRLMLGYTSDIKFSNVNFFTILADYRQYFRIAYATTFAVRGAFFYNEGKEARRYVMGGSWDLRGWPRWTIRGEKMWLSSMEFRFPLIDEVRVRFPFLTLGFFAFRGALFFDAGNAWDTQYRNTLGSIGGGIRMNLFGAIVLRYDMGKKIERNFTKLQPGLFYQFFFGWDF